MGAYCQKSLLWKLYEWFTCRFQSQPWPLRPEPQHKVKASSSKPFGSNGDLQQGGQVVNGKEGLAEHPVWGIWEAPLARMAVGGYRRLKKKSCFIKMKFI